MSISQSTPALHAAAHAGYIQKHQTKLTAAGASTRFEYWAVRGQLLAEHPQPLELAPCADQR